MNVIEKNYNWNGSLSTRKSTTRAILHHAESSNCTADDIHQWHLNRGWAGIGYHFFVRKDGSIYRGRPENTIGAHASGANSNSIGICAEGRYMTETMPDAQKNSIIELVAYLLNKYNISTVLKHKDVSSTDCPGDNFPFEEIVAGAKGTTVSNVTTSNDTSPVPDSSFTTGTYTITASDLIVRNEPGGTAVGYSGLTADGKKHDTDKDGALNKGTRITVKEVRTVGNNIWGRCPSGWVCLRYGTTVYAVKDGSSSASTGSSSASSSTSTTKALGTYEVTASDLSVRTGPGTNYRRKTYAELTADAKAHDYDKDGCINQGTRVTVKEWNGNWARIPSGWVSGDYLKKV